MSDYLNGLATIPAIAGVILAAVLTRRFVIHRIQRLAGANRHRRAATAARLYASRRAWTWATPNLSVTVTAGSDWTEQDLAEAALVDAFAPTGADQ